MLKDKDNLLLSKEECSLLEQIGFDDTTGGHLLRPRSEEDWDMRKQIFLAELAEEAETNLSAKELQMLEYLKQCTDYSYWNSLSEEDKLFIEIND